MSPTITSVVERFCIGTERPDKNRVPTTSSTSALADSTNASAKHNEASGVSIHSVSTSDTEVQQLPNKLQRLAKAFHGTENTWNPTFLQIRPLAGIAGLLIAVLCLVASLAILVLSDGQPTQSWTIQPTVYLAIVTAIANSALALAFHQAAPISWWYNASRGRTVRSLERQWHVTNSLVSALWHSKHMSVLNIACILGSFIVTDGPLLQKASTVVRAANCHDINLDLALPGELPTGFSGYLQNGVLWETVAANNLSWQWTHDRPMTVNVSKCTGLCQATVVAPGVAKDNCSTQSWPITPAMTKSINATWGPWKGFREMHGQRLASLPVFYTKLLPFTDGSLANGSEGAVLTVGMASWRDLSGQYTETICNLLPTTVEYDITIEGHTVILPQTPQQGRVISIANNTVQANQAELAKKQPNTLDALTQWLSIFVNSNASALLNVEAGPDTSFCPDASTYNPLVIQHMVSDQNFVDMLWTDPTADIMFKYNELMFRGAVLSSTWSNLTDLIDGRVPLRQRVQANETLTENVFRTDLRWYAGVAAFELVTILAVLPMFWGWWTVSGVNQLSPFSVALAFDAPILKGFNSAAGAQGVVREVGSMKVKFGAIASEDKPDDLDRDQGFDAYASGRLGFAECHSVAKPRIGISFWV